MATIPVVGSITTLAGVLSKLQVPSSPLVAVKVTGLSDSSV